MVPRALKAGAEFNEDVEKNMQRKLKRIEEQVKSAEKHIAEYGTGMSHVVFISLFNI
jgi:hypothetical protein